MITSYVALDVGQSRVGVAVANDVARIAAPLPALSNDESFTHNLQNLLAEHDAAVIVVGWPRNLSGDITDQTQYVEKFIAELEQSVNIPIERQDEAVTSVRAEEELTARGKPFSKGDIDSLSAVYILEDFMTDRLH